MTVVAYGIPYRTAAGAGCVGQRYLGYPVETAERVMWLSSKLRIYCERTYHLWWLRCDVCLVSCREGAYVSSPTHAGALAEALRHARVAHQVVI